jgi:Domain of unknown function (DUF4124)
MKMRVDRISTLAATLLLVAAQSVLAQSASRIYTCKDASGKTLTSDRPLPECQGREGRVLSKAGTTVETIQAPLTDEQKAAREAEEEKKKETAVQRAEQLRRDKALLATYQNIDDLESKRQRALLQVEREMRESEKRMSSLEKTEQENKQELEFYKRKPMPPELKRRVDENEGALRAEKLLLASKKEEIVQVNLKFDDDKRRFAELTSGPAKGKPAATAETKGPVKK